MQASSILLAEVYGIPRPDWAADAATVAQRAAAVEVRTFQFLFSCVALLVRVSPIRYEYEYC